MPDWNDPPDQQIKDALRQVLDDLGDQIDGNPSLWSVSGLEPEILQNHAAHAVATVLGRKSKDALADPNTWVQIYAMGFVVGLKYGAKNGVPQTPTG
jgi:hypothetical protein